MVCGFSPSWSRIWICGPQIQASPLFSIEWSHRAPPNMSLKVKWLDMQWIFFGYFSTATIIDSMIVTNRSLAARVQFRNAFLQVASAPLWWAQLLLIARVLFLPRLILFLLIVFFIVAFSFHFTLWLNSLILSFSKWEMPTITRKGSHRDTTRRRHRFISFVHPNPLARRIIGKKKFTLSA